MLFLAIRLWEMFDCMLSSCYQIVRNVWLYVISCYKIVRNVWLYVISCVLSFFFGIFDGAMQYFTTGFAECV
jgi:hypothetical protein